MFDDTMNQVNEPVVQEPVPEPVVQAPVAQEPAAETKVVEECVTEETTDCPECVGCSECEKLRAANTELEAGIAVVSVAMTFISVIVGLVTWMFAMKKYYKGDRK